MQDEGMEKSERLGRRVNSRRARPRLRRKPWEERRKISDGNINIGSMRLCCFADGSGRPLHPVLVFNAMPEPGLRGIGVECD
jgi:hypothetical protein